MFFFLCLRDSGKTAFFYFLKKMLVALQCVQWLFDQPVWVCCMGVYSVWGNKDNSDHHYYLIFINFIMEFIIVYNQQLIDSQYRKII